jgi:PhzF family phenazine biosynthesis protein
LGENETWDKIMTQKIYQIDAFAEKVFTGNPAAVCILHEWLSDSTMQQIAMENNLAETAYAVKVENHYEIRWFTPELEVDLCGHATLATAYVLFNYYGVATQSIAFHSPRSGRLTVEKNSNGLLIMDFPKDETKMVESSDAINNAIGAVPIKTIKGKTDYLLIYGSQREIEQIVPNFHLLNQLDCRGVIVSAPGDTVDLVYLRIPLPAQRILL